MTAREPDPDEFLRLLEESDHAIGVVAESLDGTLRVPRLLEQLDRRAVREERLRSRVDELEKHLADSVRELRAAQEQAAASAEPAELVELRTQLADRDAQLDAIHRSRVMKLVRLYWRAGHAVRGRRG